MQRPAVTVYTNYLLANTTPPPRPANLPWVPQSGTPFHSTSQVPAYLSETTHTKSGLQLASRLWSSTSCCEKNVYITKINKHRQSTAPLKVIITITVISQ